MNAQQEDKKTTCIGSVSQQARLLAVGSRQRKQNRQASMLERASEQVGI